MPTEPTDPIEASIVVCVPEEDLALEGALATAERAMARGGVELVVAGLTDADRAEQIRIRFPGAVVIVTGKPIPVAEARKRGAAAARGKRLWIVDRDAVVPVAWVDRHPPPTGVAVEAGPTKARRPVAEGIGKRFLGWVTGIGRPRSPVVQPPEMPPAPPPSHVEAAARCREKGDDDGAILHFRQALADSREPPSRAFLGLAVTLLKQERLDEAEALYREVSARFPTFRQGPAGLARVLQTRQAWKAALEAWKEVDARFPDSPEGCLGTAEVLARLGRFEEAEVLLGEATSRWPEDLQVLIAWARLASDGEAYPLAAERWRDVLARAPGNLTAHTGCVRALLDVADVEGARRVFDAAGTGPLPPWYRTILAGIYAAAFDWPAVLELFREIGEEAPDDLATRLGEVQFLVRIAIYTCQPRFLDRAVAQCESLVGRFPHSLRARAALAEGYVRASRDDDAIRVIDRLPESWITRLDVAKLKAWRQARKGDVAGAKVIWQGIERGHYLTAIHGMPGELEPIDGRPIDPRPGEVLLFTVIRNEAWRLPWFIDSYRKLGVDRFFVVDNGSTDGGIDYLLAQPDVHLFPTADSYGAAMSGMRWINELVDRHGAGHWCLYVDVDELLVFPGVEDHGLRPLLDVMDRRGHEALRAFMLDMHGPTADYRPECRPGDDLLTLFPWFDATHHRFGAVECPYRVVSGGIRRHLGNTYDLTKTPIIRGGRSIRFLSSSHQVTPGAVADVSGVLLHFKLAGAPVEWTKETIGDRRPGCVLRHLSRAMPRKTGEGDLDFMGPSTVRYESSRQLVALGLIDCPDGFIDDLARKGDGDGA